MEHPAGHTTSLQTSSARLPPPQPTETMFTIFLTALAFAACAVMGVLLLRPKQDAKELRIPFGAVSVAAVALGLVALGLWMV